MTREQLDRLFSIKIAIDTAESLLKKLQTIRNKQMELIYNYVSNNDSDWKLGISHQRENVDYVKLVKKDYNSVEIQFSSVEWNELIDAIEKAERQKIKDLETELQSL